LAEYRARRDLARSGLQASPLADPNFSFEKFRGRTGRNRYKEGVAQRRRVPARVD
jgi:hypothetical protein